MMHELWNELLQSGLSPEQMEELRYVPAESGSPYLEVQGDFMRAAAEKTIPVNPSPRLSDLFHLLLESGIFRDEEEGRLLFHTFMDLVFQIDRYTGYDKTAFLKEILLDEIRDGCFGARITKIWMQLPEYLKSRTLENLIAAYTDGDPMFCFVSEMQALFPACLLFWNREQKKKVYIYMGKKRTQIWEDRLMLAEKLFFPMDCEYRVSWEYPYALLDVEQIYCVGNRLV